MRCPKCQYISYDSASRCRNCGYELALAEDLDPLDLPIQTGDEPIGPLGDLALGDQALQDEPLGRRGARSGYTPPRVTPSHEDAVPAPRMPTPVRVSAAPTPAREMPRTGGATELPLFSEFDDRPLVTPPAVPRIPLSVRRSGPPMPRAQSRTATDEPGLDLGTPMPRSHRQRAPESEETRRDDEGAAGADGPAPAGRRLAAGLVDLLLLGGIDALVLYLTLQIVGFQLREVWLLPLVPLVGFLLLLNGGYFVAFTAAGGQTIGKMLTGIKVVPVDEDRRSDRVPLGHAALRTAAYLVSVLPAGIGYVPALIGKDHRAVHDRIADTRVVLA